MFFYASPIIWEGGRLLSSGKIPSWLEPLIVYNPVAIIVTAYRDILMNHQTPNLIGLAILFLIAIIVGTFMIYYYSKSEHKIIKAL